MRTNAYDCIISHDPDAQIDRMYENISVTEYIHDDDTLYLNVYIDGHDVNINCDTYDAGYLHILDMIGDDSSWEEIDYNNNIETDDYDILAMKNWED